MDMETISIDDSSEREEGTGPEEGEIVDDDLESISDTSITSTPWLGKFTSHKESLRALSLSSVSDLEVGEYTQTSRAKRKRTRKRRDSKYLKNTPSTKSTSDDSSDSDENVSVTKKLLREAIRIGNEEIHNNSLRTRLKGMVKDTIPAQNTIPSPLASPIPNSPTLNEQKESQDSHSSDEDTELIQLRLEALRTAVINKFEQKKKKKLAESSQDKPDSSEIDKENNCDPVNTQIEENIPGNCLEENLSNKNPTGNSVKNSEEDEDEDILRAVLLASIAKKITNKVATTPNLKLKTISDKKSVQNQQKSNNNESKPELNVPAIPRFIISVNNPDSNSEDEEKTSTSKTNQQQEEIQKKVEDEVEKFLKQQRAMVEAKQQQKTLNIPKVPQTKTIIPKTNNLYKLLPKNKQLEYEKLIQRLKSAEKKTRTRKPSIFKSKTKILKKFPAQSKAQLKEALQRTLKDMQTQVNGRLQIKGRYHILTPLMKNLNEASQEQKKYETSINTLLTQLKEARSQFDKSRDNFNNLLKEFLRKKDEIDERTLINKAMQPFSSRLDAKNVSKPPPIVKSQIPNSDEKIECKVVLDKCPINLTNPSEKIELKNETETLPKYTSPLDNNGSSNASHKINPLEIFCPFEINGTCRDKECTFNHCSNNV